MTDERQDPQNEPPAAAEARQAEDPIGADTAAANDDSASEDTGTSRSAEDEPSATEPAKPQASAGRAGGRGKRQAGQEGVSKKDLGVIEAWAGFNKHHRSTYGPHMGDKLLAVGGRLYFRASSPGEQMRGVMIGVRDPGREGRYETYAIVDIEGVPEPYIAAVVERAGGQVAEADLSHSRAVAITR